MDGMPWWQTRYILRQQLSPNVSTFLAALTERTPDCYNGQVVVGPRHNGDVSSGSMTHNSVID